MQYNANVTDDSKLENGKHCHLKKQTKKKRCHVVAPHFDEDKWEGLLHVPMLYSSGMLLLLFMH